ncbi:MAG: glycosyltransferase family 2 protein [Armatimonadetes bacterium]|nr:glycosyltransferase family 2 protein [Armatimonadota bacterium]
MIAVVLPAYNEAESLPTLLAAFPPALQPAGIDYRVLVVDDGSSDETAASARAMAAQVPLTVVPHQVNRGLGAALRTGLEAALALDPSPEAVVTLDADNTHPPDLIPTMVTALRDGAEVVIASRYAPGGAEVGLSPVRSLLSRGASLLLATFCRVPGARDYTCGYRAYSGELLNRAVAHYGDGLVEEAGFTCMAELLIKLAALGARVAEVPLVLRYDLKGGASKMRVGRTIRRYGGLIRALRRDPRLKVAR